jgi:hypothetical protein
MLYCCDYDNVIIVTNRWLICVYCIVVDYCTATLAAEGEIINDNSKCPHVFHKACLIAWLDMHDVCPCCRCTMITDSEWRHAAAHTSDAEATNDVDRRPTRDAEEMVETVEEESNGLEVNESSNEQGQVAVSITPVLTTNDGMEDPRAVESA